MEIAVDINTHILVSKGHNVPTTSYDTFSASAQYGFISAHLANKLAPSVELRDLVIHGCVEVAPRRVADAVGHALTHYASNVTAIDDWIAQHQ